MYRANTLFRHHQTGPLKRRRPRRFYTICNNFKTPVHLSIIIIILVVTTRKVVHENLGTEPHGGKGKLGDSPRVLIRVKSNNKSTFTVVIVILNYYRVRDYTGIFRVRNNWPSGGNIIVIILIQYYNKCVNTIFRTRFVSGAKYSFYYFVLHVLL